MSQTVSYLPRLALQCADIFQDMSVSFFALIYIYACREMGFEWCIVITLQHLCQYSPY